MNTIPEGAIPIFKFVSSNFQSLRGGVSPSYLDYSGPWPKEIKVDYWESPINGLGGAGIHMVPMIDNIDFGTNMIYGPNVVAGYVMPEDIIFRAVNGPIRAKKITITHQPTREEIIGYILQNSEVSLFYACHVDKKPEPDTRRSVCNRPIDAFLYAVNVDKAPTRETWQAVQKRPVYADMYLHSFKTTKEQLDALL